MTTRLTDLDFMMMDVHRPMTDDEIAKINPQALVDKSAGAIKIVDGHDESMGAPHSCESKTGSRCDICFAPMPCEPHANVEHLDAVTSLDIDPIAVLAGAYDAGLTEIVVVGMKKDGGEYFASSIADAAPAVYHLQRGIYKLNKIVDGEHEDDNIGPRRPAA